MNVVLPNRLTVDEFLAWAVRQPREAGKFELLNGAVVVQHAQRYGHYKVNVAMHRAMEAAIRAAGIPYYATGEGPTVRIDTSTAFEPDALVAPLPEPDWDSLEIGNPVVVVEALDGSHGRGCKVETILRVGERSALPHSRPGRFYDYASQARLRRCAGDAGAERRRRASRSSGSRD